MFSKSSFVSVAQGGKFESEYDTSKIIVDKHSTFFFIVKKCFVISDITSVASSHQSSPTCELWKKVDRWWLFVLPPAKAKWESDIRYNDSCLTGGFNTYKSQPSSST